MSYTDNNPYYSPDQFGLILVGVADLDEAFYSYDYLAVWRDIEDENKFYLATDSGCSCPTPFEYYRDLNDLTGPLTAVEAIAEAGSIKKTSYKPDYDQEGFEDLIVAIIAASGRD